MKKSLPPVCFVKQRGAAFFSNGFVHESLVAGDDPGATWNNLQTSNLLFKAEILGWLIILICDIVVAWAFYIFLKPIHRPLALLGAWFRLTYAAMLGGSILILMVVLLLTNQTGYLSALDHEQLQAGTMLFLNAFELAWSAGLILFGGHLLIVGYVAFTSSSIPKVISVLLLLASVGYIVIHLCNVFLPQFEGMIAALEFLFSLPMMLGELGFGLWLMFRGGRAAAKG
ncbi:DUF4386 domain-containing protein [Paenibacillus macerans]|uniref:DUF4386 domain-containing protein n=1 Tax=Paenibacillus macerans TaxID=44252 RepID=UPI003D321F42